MTATWAWTRLDLRRRWRSLIVLTLLVAVAGAVVMTAAAGARRGASAAERLDDATLHADAVVLPNEVGFDWDRFRRLEYVEGLTTFLLGYPIGVEGVDFLDVSFPPGDDEMLRTVEAPVVYEGRVFEADATDEAVVTRSFADHYDVAVGDSLDVRLASVEDQRRGLTETVGYDDLHGPTARLTVVGVVGSPWLLDHPEGHGTILPSPGFTTEFHDNLWGFPDLKTAERPYANAMLRLEHGEADLPRLARDVERITGRSDIEVWNLADWSRDQTEHLEFEAACLAAFALAALLAALLLVGQAIARYVRAGMAELGTLRALGLTPSQALLCASLPLAPVALAGAGMGLVGAIVASRWMPIGTAALAEPDPGVQIDPLVLVPGVVATVALVAGCGWVSALLAARGPRARSRRSAVAGLTGDLGLPVPVQLGTRYALEAGWGPTAIPVRPALIACVAGALGVVAALTFSHGVQDAADHPQRFGVTFDAIQFLGYNGEEFLPRDTVAEALGGLDEVEGFSTSRSAVVTGPGGDGSVTVWEISEGDKPLDVVITHGRMAEIASEIVLGPEAMRTLGVGVGDRIELAGSRTARPMTVVGAGFAPEGPHNGYADAGLLTTGGYDALFDDFKFSVALVDGDDSIPDDEVAATVERALADADADLPPMALDPAEPPVELTLLQQVVGLPEALAGFLVLLAVGAVGHALATAVRRRAHDVAVARALGMTQGQVRWIVVTQATVLATVGLVFGVPLGLALGRTVWRIAADYTPVEYVPPTAVIAMLLVGPSAVLLANLLAAWPARRAARSRIAAVLRAE